MAISNTFGSFYRSNSGLMNTTLLMLFLIGIEAILDGRFECPSSSYSPVLAGIYSLSFFLCPAIIFIIFGLIYFPGANKKRHCPCWGGQCSNCYVFIHVGKIPLIWLLIVMSDGQYLACFVVAVSHYRLDLNLYTYIFQTSGMLALTVACAIWYFVSRFTCESLEESRRTYSLLHDVEHILERDEFEKEKEEDSEMFLRALKRKAAFQCQTLPQYMLDKESVLVEKLKEEHGAAPPPEGE